MAKPGQPETPPPRRIRRSAEAAREHILAIAEARLAEAGLKGLGIKEVAADAGINHGTLIHHFGSADGMRTALLERMTARLIEDMLTVLDDGGDPDAMYPTLFNALTESGHVKLLAWRAIDGVALDDPGDAANLSGTVVDLFGDVISKISERSADTDVEAIRHSIALAVTSAVGWGVCGEGLSRLLGMTTAQPEGFTNWVSTRLNTAP